MEVTGQLNAPATLPLGGRAPGTHWIRGCVGHTTILDTGGVQEDLLPLPGIETPFRRLPACSSLLYRMTYNLAYLKIGIMK
jgi:hypothetical protein